MLKCPFIHFAAATKYALHRTIGAYPHTMDIFTSAGDLVLSESAIRNRKQPCYKGTNASG